MPAPKKPALWGLWFDDPDDRPTWINVGLAHGLVAAFFKKAKADRAAKIAGEIDNETYHVARLN